MSLFHNTNKLLSKSPYCNGLKTGYTRASGNCLISSGKNGSREVIIVVLGSNSGNIWKDSEKLMHWALGTWPYQNMIKQKMEELKLGLEKKDVPKKEETTLSTESNSGVTSSNLEDNKSSTILDWNHYKSKQTSPGSKLSSFSLRTTPNQCLD